MATWIALLRGINVGGRNRLPMSELVRELESLKLKEVATYIQSGNVVFRASRVSAKLGDTVAAAIEKRHGFRPYVLIMSKDHLQSAIEGNPFPEAEQTPQLLHLLFLAERPASPDVTSLEAAKSSSERFELVDRVFYLHAPDGIARSKLAARAEKLLGVPATGRNWRTVTKLQRMTAEG